MIPEQVEKLATLRGIGDVFHDFRGELRYFSLQSKIDLLRVMGCPVDDDTALAAQIRAMEAESLQALLPMTAISRGERLLLDVNIPARQFGLALVWTLKLDDGSIHEGATPTTAMQESWRGEVDGIWYTRRRFDLPFELPEGQHELVAKLSGGENCTSRLIVAPRKCHTPPPLRAGRRLWGVAVQLYSVRSRSNWGMGDFGDLLGVVRWLAPLGAGFIALNPLHALAPGEPQRASPYSASNRNFLNILYVDIAAVPELSECEPARTRVASDEFKARCAELRSAQNVDYTGVAALKLELLRTLYAHFRAHHLALDTPRAQSFRDYVAMGDQELRAHALFDAIDAHFIATRGGGSGWQGWPGEFANPASSAVEQFAVEHADEVQFFMYAQWLANEQLRAVQALAVELGMAIGLYGDFAVGAHPSGSEVWSQQNLFRLGAEIGAPPDALALKGQGWGLPPQDPRTLLTLHMRPFRSLLKNNMRYYGALRFDHVMALFRQWWVAAGQSPALGAYVHYPMDNFMAVLALESERHRCLIVGEDLGTVPDAIRLAMPQNGLLHYKVLLFEREDGRFRKPQAYAAQSLATATTHDMPTLRSFWEGKDIDLRVRLDLYPNPDMPEQERNARAHDRWLLLSALEEQGLWSASGNVPDFSMALVSSIHAYLARTSAELACVQIEDLIGMTDPVNVPGTYLEYPNWQRKVTVDLEDIAANPEITAMLERVNRERAPTSA